MSVGRHGSPGKVRPEELLHSVLIRPSDLDGEQIALTIVTHAEQKGMSVLRDSASNEEFNKIVSDRIKNNAKRTFHGVASLRCDAVRSMKAPIDDVQRKRGDRLYCVLDTDMDGLPNHADIFATVPRPHESQGHKAAWRKEREKMLVLLLGSYISPDQFRGGAFQAYGVDAQANP